MGSKMPPPQSVAMGGHLRIKDPFDWTEDDVVSAFCDRPSQFFPPERIQNLKGIQYLADALRENEVNGEVLLTINDEQTLRNDLGIQILGRRCMIINLINELRSKSPKYKEYVSIRFENDSSAALDKAVRHLSRAGTPYGVSPYHSAGYMTPRPAGSAYAESLRSPLQGNEFSEGCFPSVEEKLSTKTEPRIEGKSSTEGQQSLRDLVSLRNEQPVPTAAVQQIPQKIPQVSYETQITDERGHKRRRLVLGQDSILQAVPTALTDSREAELADAFEAGAFEPELNPTAKSMQVTGDELIHSGDEKHQLDYAALKISSPHVKIPGRKRIHPTLISGTEAGMAVDDVHLDEGVILTLSDNPTSPSKIAQSVSKSKGRNIRGPDDIYLGPRAMPVDQIFYDDVAIGCTIPTDQTADEFTLTSKNLASSGQSLYVHARLRHYLQQMPLKLPYSKRNLGIIPYPDQIGRNNSPRSITVFSATEGQIIASRANRNKVLPKGSQQKIMGTVFNTDYPSMSVDMGEDEDWSALEKWKYVQDDELLPTYGDSGSEGEYDLDVWQEMEQENGQPIGRPQGTLREPLLAPEEVSRVLDAEIDNFRQQWVAKKLPKVKLKAWRIWIRARNSESTLSQLEILKTQIEHLQERMNKLRIEISRESWNRASSLVKQCKIAQPTVFDLEEALWTCEVLKSPQAPTRIFLSHEKKSRAEKGFEITEPLAEDEEDVGSSEGASDDESDGSLADFVVEEPEPDQAAGDDDMTMADIEDSNDSDTLVYIKSDPPVATPRKKKDTTLRSSETQIIDLTQHSNPRTPNSTPKLVNALKSAATKKRDPFASSGDDSGSNRLLRSATKKQIAKIAMQPAAGAYIDLTKSDSEDNKIVSQKATVKELPSFRQNFRGDQGHKMRCINEIANTPYVVSSFSSLEISLVYMIANYYDTLGSRPGSFPGTVYECWFGSLRTAQPMKGTRFSNI